MKYLFIGLIEYIEWVSNMEHEIYLNWALVGLTIAAMASAATFKVVTPSCILIISASRFCERLTE